MRTRVKKKSRNEMNYLTPALFSSSPDRLCCLPDSTEETTRVIRIKVIRLSGAINPSFMVLVLILISLIRDHK